MPTMSLGDRIEATLKSVGVTQERYQAFKETVGLPGECDCRGRQQFLNDAETWMKAVSSEFGEKAAEAIARFWAPVSWLRNRRK